MKIKTPTSQTIYNTDFVQWIKVTVKELRSQNYTAVDWENLIREPTLKCIAVQSST
ncbi:MAG: hypothetical protein DCF22_04565 [Leptolyngbya sp.]|nr:MAG: hypothetical protein DCF22_04565 [Leptolyngbya sp.]